MKILAFTDTHGSMKAMKEIAEKAVKEKVDLLVCAGDVSIFEQGLEYLLQRFDKIGIPMLIIPGNHETEEELEKVSSKFENINHIQGKHYERDDVLFFGYGGGGFSIVDPDFVKKGKEFEEKIKKSGVKKVVLVTHAPPHNTKIDRLSKESVGNKSIRQFIDKVKPVLVISGHLHENAGKEDKVGKTKVINPGPFGKVLNI
ncbi:MAG: metallophosphoesterase [Candidatus Woesearchaeota archaeon]|jgi:Icc-related predicted phosphoesterase|nr:metallophosphoesterase [Candidatus Woesearchaeota archaeon]|tara:strand:+ start:355 stop:957 length:603 start_codon:yes stop_codon:yes gene_type:complete